MTIFNISKKPKKINLILYREDILDIIKFIELHTDELYWMDDLETIIYELKTTNSFAEALLLFEYYFGDDVDIFI